MEWNNGMVIEFLEAYGTEPTIWDLRNEDHKKKSLTQEAWQRVLNRLDWDCTIDDLKKKRDSLMAYYRIHWNKARQWKMTNGAEGAQDYATSWFAFDTMNKFLGEIYDINNEESRQEIRTSKNEKSIRKRPPKRKYEESPQREKESDSDDSTYEIETKPTPKYRVLEDNSIDPLETTQETPATDDASVDEEDESELYGKLLAYKLRKFKEEDRLILMNDIDNLLFRARMKTLSKKKPRNIPTSSVGKSYSQEDTDTFE